ncbi:MAG TPA: capsule assembly Wzi family protein, partial [Longimicrobiales bacterium]|nr:capsule assembly Wzi family protein [Longimicrobiales bacterium]
MRRRSALFAAMVALMAPAAALAQVAPVFIEPGHWSYAAIRRLSVAGVAPAASDPTPAPVTRALAAAIFAHAQLRAAERGAGDLAGLAQAWLERLHAEGDTAGVVAGAQVRAGWTATAGEALAGQGQFKEEDWTGAQPIAGASAPAAALRAHGFLHPSLSWSVDAGRLGNEWVVPAAALGFSIGAFDGWAGRRRLHYGVGHGGGTVLGSGLDQNPELARRTVAPFDGLGLHVREPFHFPYLLRYLGPTRIEIAAGQLARNGKVEDPYIVFGRLISSPFTRRFTLGINRGAIFGGEGNPITVGRLLGLLIGLHGGEAGEFENQVFSTIMKIRP